MHHLVGMKNTLSRFNPGGVEIDDYGNYNLEVGGVEGTLLANKLVLNLYFLNSGDYSIVPSMHGYGWIKVSQQVWFQQTSWSLQTKYMNEQPKQKAPTPSLVYFHIPLPEFSSFTASNFTRVKKEGISSPSINSGFFASMVEAGDVKAAFIDHDHTNNFCGKLSGIQLCYAGGFGYHAYGKARWSRRARVVYVQFEKTVSGEWRGVKSIKTWKRLDGQHLTTIDSEVLWNKGSNGACACICCRLAVPGDKTSYLSKLRSGREVIVVDQNGLWRAAIVGRLKIESRPLILVEVKRQLDLSLLTEVNPLSRKF